MSRNIGGKSHHTENKMKTFPTIMKNLSIVFTLRLLRDKKL